MDRPAKREKCKQAAHPPSSKGTKFSKTNRGTVAGGFTDKQKGIMRHYHRLLRKEQRQAGTSEDQSTQISRSIDENKKRMKMTAYQRAKMEFEAKEAEKKEKREEQEMQAKERDAALKKYRKEKFRKFHKLTQKTKKGQPVMKGRIEVLLEKIQASVAEDSGP